MTEQLPVLALALTWLFVAVGIVGLGVLAKPVLLRCSGFPGSHFVGAAWVGFLIVTILALGLDVLLPLQSPLAGWILVLLLIGGLVASTRQLFVSSRAVKEWKASHWLWLPILIAVLIVYAGWALGEPGNYDTGLYHIGSINYARDYPLVPGLANLHERFGFNSSMWPLSAWTGNLGWRGDEFRLINGTLLTLLFLDVAARTRGFRRRDSRPGTVVLIISLTLTLGVFAQYPGRLLASSAQDSAAFILGMVAVAYFSDAMSYQRWWAGSRGTAAVVVALAAALAGALMRPLGWALFAGLALIAMGSAIHGNAFGRALRSVMLILTVSVFSLAVTATRDYLLSGWFLYPAGVIGFPVDWRFPDPSVSADRITAWARTPFQDVDETLASNQWIGGWLERLPTDWSVPAAGLLLVIFLLLWWKARRSHHTFSWRPVVLTLTPVVLFLGAWLVTAPDPRFAWAGIVCLGAVPLAFISRGLSLARLLSVSGAFLLALLLLAGFRGSWQAWSPAPERPPVPETVQGALSDGRLVESPTPQDQCWTVYPSCRPQYENPNIEYRGPSVGDGFRPVTIGP